MSCKEEGFVLGYINNQDVRIRDRLGTLQFLYILQKHPVHTNYNLKPQLPKITAKYFIVLGSLLQE